MGIKKIRVMKCQVRALENRFDPSYDYLASMGYRDLGLNVQFFGSGLDHKEGYTFNLESL